MKSSSDYPNPEEVEGKKRSVSPYSVLGFLFVFALAAVFWAFWAYDASLAKANDDLKARNRELISQGRVSDASLKECRLAQREYSVLNAVLEDVASVPYANPGANCYDHAKKLVSDLYEKGFMSSIMVNSDRSHAWVAVWVDANTGRIVRENSFNQKLLEIRDRSLKVVCAVNK